MEATQERTAGEWIAAPSHDEGYSRITTAECKARGYSDTIAREVRDADAAYICKAVNSHDALVAALRQCKALAGMQRDTAFAASIKSITSIALAEVA